MRREDGWSDRPMWDDPYTRPRSYRVSFGAGANDPYTQPRRKAGVLKFSATELNQLFHATIILTLAFGIHFASTSNWGLIQYTILMAFPAVASGFVLHEMGHKYFAQRYGAWSEFRAYYMGLMFALMLSPMIIFAAPGAVMISGRLRKKEIGILSLAGPMVNLGIVLVCIPAYVFLTAGHFGTIIGMDVDPDTSAMGLLAGSIFYMVWINILLAAFNLLPVPPLDGSKVIRWNVGVYLAAFIIVAAVADALLGVGA